MKVVNCFSHLLSRTHKHISFYEWQFFRSDDLADFFSSRR